MEIDLVGIMCYISKGRINPTSQGELSYLLGSEIRTKKVGLRPENQLLMVGVLYHGRICKASYGV